MGKMSRNLFGKNFPGGGISGEMSGEFYDGMSGGLFGKKFSRSYGGMFWRVY